MRIPRTMHIARPTGYLRTLAPVAVLTLLAALLALFPSPARAQDLLAPFILSAAVDGTSVVLIYHEALDESSVPATTAYSVSVAGTAAAPSNVSIAGSKVTLTLASAASSGDTVTVTYTVPTTSPVQDAGGHAAAGLTAQAVANFTGATTNQPAFASSTATRSVAENVAEGTSIGSPVTATDADAGDTLSYSLSQFDGNRFSVTSSGQLQTKAALDYETTTSYVVTLYVSDGEGPDGTSDSSAIDDSVVVTISITNVNDEPDISGSALPEVKENTTTVGTYTVTDDDTSDTHTWSVESDTTIEGNEDGALFAINSSGVLSFSTAPDYEMPNSNDDTNVYYVRIKVTDNGSPAKSDTEDIIVEVTNVNEAPALTNPTTSIMVSENTAATTVLATYTGSDPDGDSLLFSLMGADSGDLFLALKSGTDDEFELKFNSSPNYESPADSDTNNVYTVTIGVRDNKVNTDENNGGSDAVVDNSVTVNVTVTNVNEAPAFNTGLSTTINVDENTAANMNIGSEYTATDPESGDTLTYTLSDTTMGSNDASAFTINSSGQIQTSGSLNYETKTSYAVTVNVRDSKINASLSNGNSDTAVDASLAITINIRNVNEDGTASITGTLSGGSTLTANLTDPDGSISSQTYQWMRGDSATGTFTNITTNGTSSTYTLVAADVTKYLKVRISYTDGHGSGQSDTSDAVGPIGASNSKPTFDDGTSTTRSVNENVGSGTNVGSAVAATDSDTGDTLTYSMIDTVSESGDASAFDISSTTGQITTKSGVTLDHETKASYAVTVRVHDGKDAAGNSDTTIDDTIPVTISIDDVNEAPVISTTATTANFAENTASTTGVITLEADDVDDGDPASSLTWSVESANDGGKFQISSAGVLAFQASPDFETPTDAGDTAMNNTYVVTVKVEDDESPTPLSDTHTVTVTVTNVNEAPTFSSGPTSVNYDENQAATTIVATYAASDVDASTTLSWTLEGDDASDFNLTENMDGDYDLTFKASPNYEEPHDANTDGDFSVTVKVTDNGIPGNSSTLNVTRTLTVSLQDVNDKPVITGNQSPSEAEIPFDLPQGDEDLAVVDYEYTDEDVPADTITWSVGGTDAADFTIDSSTGELSFASRPDFENPTDRMDSAEGHDSSNNTYEVIVKAYDGDDTTDHAVTVTVTNINENPEVPAGVANENFAEIEYHVAANTANLQVMTYTPRDEETAAAMLNWSLGGTDAGDFTITKDSTTGVGTLTFRNEPDFEMPADADTDNVYEVTVRISDGPNTRDYSMTVTVTDVNERPDISEDFNPPQNYMEIEYDSTAARPDVHTFTAQDYDDGDTFTWSLLGTDAGDLDIGTNTGVLTFTQVDSLDVGPLPNFEHPQDDTGDSGSNTYNVTVRATDNHGKTEDYDVIVTVTNVNEQPSFTGTPETTITLDEQSANVAWTATNVASYAAHDEEGGVTWSLTGTDRLDFEIDSTGAVTFAAEPNFEDPDDADGDNEYEFNVVVTDVMSGSPRRSAMRAVTVTVEDIEEDGAIAIREGDESPAVGDAVFFTLTDPDGGIVTAAGTAGFTWGIERRTASPQGNWQNVEGTNNLSTTTSYTTDEDDVGYQFRAVVTSYQDRRGSGKSAESEPTDAVTADPRPNVPPRFRTGGDFPVSEGVENVDFAEIRATDRDGDTLTFNLEQEPGSQIFVMSRVNNETVRLRLNEELDYESTPNGFLLITVTVHDGKDDDGNPDSTVDATLGITVTILDVEEEGVVTFSPQEPEAGAPQAASLSDGDGNVSGLSWQWSRSLRSDSGFVNILGANSHTYTPDEDDEDYYLKATASYTDNRGSGKSAEAVTGPVPSENKRPLFPSTETGQRTVAENSRSGTAIGDPVAAVDPERNPLTYTLTGADAGSFTIVASTGQIRVKDDLDFETRSSYSVTVEVHDGRDGSGASSTAIDDMQDVTITVENVEEPGTVTLTSETQSIQARVPVTASLEDDDIPSNISWQWSRSTNRSNWINIGNATTATFTPADTDAGNYIRATATYDDGEDSGKTAQAVSPRVGQPPPVNSAPAFPATEDGRREVAEDAPGGTAIGAPFTASDFNNDPLTYSLSGTDAATFTIDANSGQLRVAQSATLDFETKRTLRVTVQVTDGANSLGDPDNDAIDDRINAIITLTDVNEPPEVTGDDDPSFQENSSSIVATYRATDPERGTLTWSVGDTATFWISQQGQLHFVRPPSYEVGTTHPVTITAEDDGGLSGSLIVSVTVTDLEEAGTVSIEPRRGWDGTSFLAELDDDDGGVAIDEWQWQRSSNRSSWGDISGATSSSYTAGADDINQYLRVTVAYEDNRGSDKSASAALAGRIGDSADQPASNNAPEFPDATAGRSVGQGTAAGRNIGAPVRATDADSGDILTYELAGSDADLFDIDPATGQLKTRAVLDYDSEGTNTYTVTVDVHDGFDTAYSPSTSIDDSVTVTITVTQVARRSLGSGSGGSSGGGGGSSGGGGGGFVPPPVAPKFVDGALTVRPLAQTARAGDAVGDPVAATHPSSDALRYSLNGTNAALFTVDEETGQIRLRSPLALQVGETYTVNVTATDSSQSSAQIAVVIEVVKGPADPYDLNGNGTIEGDEILAAISAYLVGLAERETILELISRYLLDQSRS